MICVGYASLLSVVAFKDSLGEGILGIRNLIRRLMSIMVIFFSTLFVFLILFNFARDSVPIFEHLDFNTNVLGADYQCTDFNKTEVRGDPKTTVREYSKTIDGLGTLENCSLICKSLVSGSSVLLGNGSIGADPYSQLHWTKIDTVKTPHTWRLPFMTKEVKDTLAMSADLINENQAENRRCISKCVSGGAYYGHYYYPMNFYDLCKEGAQLADRSTVGEEPDSYCEKLKINKTLPEETLYEMEKRGVKTVPIKRLYRDFPQASSSQYKPLPLPIVNAWDAESTAYEVEIEISLDGSLKEIGGGSIPIYIGYDSFHIAPGIDSLSYTPWKKRYMKLNASQNDLAQLGSVSYSSCLTAIRDFVYDLIDPSSADKLEKTQNVLSTNNMMREFDKYILDRKAELEKMKNEHGVDEEELIEYEKLYGGDRGLYFMNERELHEYTWRLIRGALSNVPAYDAVDETMNGKLSKYCLLHPKSNFSIDTGLASKPSDEVFFKWNGDYAIGNEALRYVYRLGNSDKYVTKSHGGGWTAEVMNPEFGHYSSVYQVDGFFPIYLLFNKEGDLVPSEYTYTSIQDGSTLILCSSADGGACSRLVGERNRKYTTEDPKGKVVDCIRFDGFCPASEQPARLNLIEQNQLMSQLGNNFILSSRLGWKDGDTTWHPVTEQRAIPEAWRPRWEWPTITVTRSPGLRYYTAKGLVHGHIPSLLIKYPIYHIDYQDWDSNYWNTNYDIKKDFELWEDSENEKTGEPSSPSIISPLGGHTIFMELAKRNVVGGSGLQYAIIYNDGIVSEGDWSNLNVGSDGKALISFSNFNRKNANLYLRLAAGPDGETPVLLSSPPESILGVKTVGQSTTSLVGQGAPSIANTYKILAEMPPGERANFYNLFNAAHKNLSAEVKVTKKEKTSGPKDSQNDITIFRWVVGVMNELAFGIREVGGRDNPPGAAELLFKSMVRQNVQKDGTVVREASPLLKIVRGMLALHVLIMGISFMFGLYKDTRREVISRIMRIALVVALISPGSWDFFYRYLFDSLVVLNAALSEIFFKAFMSLGIVSFDYTPADLNTPFGFLSVLDDLLLEIYSGEVLLKVAVFCTSAITDFVVRLGDLMCGGKSHPLLTAFILLVLFSLTTLFVIFGLASRLTDDTEPTLLTISGIMSFLFACLSIVIFIFKPAEVLLYVVYISGFIKIFRTLVAIMLICTTSIILLAFFVTMTPIFLPLCLFESTKQLFQSWYKMLFSLIMQPVAVVVGFCFIFSLILISFKSLLFYGACTIPIFTILGYSFVGLIPMSREYASVHRLVIPIIIYLLINTMESILKYITRTIPRIFGALPMRTGDLSEVAGGLIRPVQETLKAQRGAGEQAISAAEKSTEPDDDQGEGGDKDDQGEGGDKDEDKM